MEPSGTQYTGVDETHAGRQPGIKKMTIQLEPGIYKTLAVKLTLHYAGHADHVECSHPYKVVITIPEKWLDNPTPASALKGHFLKAYRKKHSGAELSQQDDEDVNLAIKDESLFQFSRELLADQAILTEVLYDRQDVWVMGPADWDAMEEELARARKAVVDALHLEGTPCAARTAAVEVKGRHMHVHVHIPIHCLCCRDEKKKKGSRTASPPVVADDRCLLQKDACCKEKGQLFHRPVVTWQITCTCTCTAQKSTYSPEATLQPFHTVPLRPLR